MIYFDTKVIDNMVDKYNSSIEMCEDNPLFVNSTICGIEDILNIPVAQKRKRETKSRNIYRNNLDSDEDDVESSISERMCGCKLTAMVMFVMLYSNLQQPSGEKFKRNYDIFFNNEKNNIINTIVNPGMMSTKLARVIDDISIGKIKGVYLSLPTSHRLFIVQVLRLVKNGNVAMTMKYGDGIYNVYGEVHSFIVIKLKNRMYRVLSSWHAGTGASATPIISTDIDYNTLESYLRPENINKEEVNFLWGKNNNFGDDTELVTVFISEDTIINSAQTATKYHLPFNESQTDDREYNLYMYDSKRLKSGKSKKRQKPKKGKKKPKKVTKKAKKGQKAKYYK